MANNPLWIPTGSIRALIALAFVAATIAAVFVLEPGRYDVLLPFTGAVVERYFRDRRDAQEAAHLHLLPDLPDPEEDPESDDLAA